jgi:hypothetical protein
MSTADPETRHAVAPLAVLAWIGVGALSLEVGLRVGRALVHADLATVGWRAVLHDGGEALVAALPALCLVGALVDFARFFGRVGEGDVFTERNVRTLRSGAEGLLAAAVASAVVTPTVLGWIGEEPTRGVIFEANDLALGVAAVGLALGGLAHVFREAVRLKLENDEFV